VRVTHVLFLCSRNRRRADLAVQPA
jgi:predicted protein tyrosine phosphatase